MRRALALAIVIAFLVGAPGVAGAQSSSGNGQAQATAQVVKIGPGVGALELATSAGTAVSQVANVLAQAKAQAIDLGLVGTALTAEGCDGDPGAVRPEQLPQPLIIDNRKGDATATADEIPVSAILGGGRKTVSASTKPASEAIVESIVASIASVVSVSSGRANALTRVVAKGTREAEATVSVDVDLGGVVRLQNMQWRAVHRTGSEPSAVGTFSMTQGTAGGVPIPIDQLGPAQAAMNTALAPLGMTVDLPRVEHITKPNDVIRVTPLVVTLKDSPAGKTVFGPLLNASREQREQLFNTITAEYCQAAGLLLVGDIGLDIVSGTGFLTIQIGGVEATSADLELFNPFGSNDPLGAVDEVFGDVFTSFSPGLPSLAPTGVIPPQLGRAELVPVRTVCESVSASRRVGCSKGAALPIGIVGLLVTAAVAAFDWRRRRALAA